MAVLEVPTPEAFEREVLQAREPTLVAFWAGWCPFCRAFRPIFEAWAERLASRFAIVRLDAEDNPLWDRYAVRVVPSVAYFSRGQLVKRLDGILRFGIAAKDFESFLREVLPAAPAA